ncbi:hypothetical protein MANES_05G053100v8 [Manihot esculenta]|uniref:Uncharacterized protein n=1 Tax=Manihot esculenta TaxID=3983 RepID=A0A2C9VTK1_MANES|nr:hypothetical protein MANES_05G053100v8 [Manihot esculenta]
MSSFWELVHLLFIGVAVSYGLFSRRNAEVDFQTHSNNYDYDDSQSSFVSRIFHVSPIFEDGHENSCGSDEKNLYQSWNSQFYRGESDVTVPNGSSAINEVSKTESINFEKETEISLEQDENNVAQAWNSQYFRGESVVLLSQANYGIGEWEKPAQVVGYKPLGLPIRSLKSKIRNSDSAQFSNGSESSPSLIGSPCSSGRSMEEEHFGDLGPSNLEENFDESVSSSAQIPWRSRSGRAEMWERVGSVAGSPLHFRPLSVDETQFESLKSHSFRSTPAFSSQASSISNSPTRLSPSESVCSDSPNSGTLESGKKEDFRASYPHASQSQKTTVNREARLNAFHLRRYSSGSLFQKDLKGTSKDKLKDRGGRKEDPLGSKERGEGSLKLDNNGRKEDSMDSKERGQSSLRLDNNGKKEDSMGSKERGQRSLKLDDNGRKEDSMASKERGQISLKLDNNGRKEDSMGSEESGQSSLRLDNNGRKEDSMGSEEKGQGSLKFDKKPATIVKTPSRGRSVRTIRSGVYSPEPEATKIAEISKTHSDDKAGKGSDEGKAVNTGKNEKKNLDTHYDVPMPTYAKFQKREKDSCLENVDVESENDSESETDSSTPASSDEGTGTDPVRDAGLDPNDSEVDKKAGEFIAKFREQIRLQKVASIERSRRKRMSSKHLS